MTDIQHRQIDSNGISMHVAEAGDGPLVVLCHGFPELWYSWRHQIPAIADAGYRVVAPDMRGYGRTDQPPEVTDYDMPRLVGDVAGILDHYGSEQAVVVGHDWGAAVVWGFAIAHPERCSAVINLSVPYRPRGPRRPMEAIKELVGDGFFYQLYFQPVGPADEELAGDVRTSLRRMAYSWSGDGFPHAMKQKPAAGTGLLDTISDPPEPPDWITDDEFGVYVDEFTRTGFTGGLNWYRNIDRNWELSEPDQKVTPPTLFVAGERDGVLAFIPPDAMDDWVTDLRAKVIVPEEGHWVQQEAPQAVNDAIVSFLREV